MREVVVAEKDTGKVLGVYRMRDTSSQEIYMPILARRLKMEVVTEHYSDGMVSRWNYWLKDKNGKLYRAWLNP